MISRVYKDDELRLIHKLSIFHRSEIPEKDHICGCFCCIRTFDSCLITKWTDKGTTALCPFCGVDSVIPNSKEYPITDVMLAQMYQKYFNFEK